MIIRETKRERRTYDFSPSHQKSSDSENDKLKSIIKELKLQRNQFKKKNRRLVKRIKRMTQTKKEIEETEKKNLIEILSILGNENVFSNKQSKEEHKKEIQNLKEKVLDEWDFLGLMMGLEKEKEVFKRRRLRKMLNLRI